MRRKDPIIEEIHAVREKIACEADDDVEKMLEEARARQATAGLKAVRLEARKPVSMRKAS